MPGVESSRVLTSCARRLDSSSSWPRISTEKRLPSPPVAARHAAHLLAARRPRAHDDAGQARQLAAQRHGDLIARALALVLGHQAHVDVAAVAGAAAAEAAATAAAAGRRDEHRRFGHELAGCASFEPDQHRFGELDARADRQLRVDGDFAFVGRRLELEADARQQHERGDEQRRRRSRTRSAGGRSDDVQQPRVGVVDAVQHAIAERGRRAPKTPVRAFAVVAAAAGSASTAPARS